MQIAAVQKPFFWDSRYYNAFTSMEPAQAFRVVLAHAIRLSLFNNREAMILRHQNGAFETGFEPMTLLRLPHAAEIFARVNGWELKYE